MDRKIMTIAGGTSDSGGEATSQYGVLRAMLVAGEFAPGDQLVAGRLSQKLGVSRTPIREALVLLEKDGVLRQAPRGHVVIDPSPQELMQLLEARAGVDAFAAELAATRRSGFDVARIGEIHERSQGEGMGNKRLHELFHRSIRQAAHNPLLEEWLDTLDFRLAVCDTDPQTSEASNMSLIHDEHTRIVEAIAAEDPAGARAAMLDHHQRYQQLRMRLLARRDLPL